MYVCMYVCIVYVHVMQNILRKRDSIQETTIEELTIG